MELKIFTDGGSLNNPGQAAIAYVAYFNDKIVQKFSKRIGINSNNFAEYSALFEALKWVKNNTPNYLLKITCFSDSNLLVNQLNRLYKIKNAAIRDFVMKIRVLEQEIKIPIFYKHIPREENGLADSLIKKELSFYS